eukprot:4730059-Pyramimonas_sp.AAC.1
MDDHICFSRSSDPRLRFLRPIEPVVWSHACPQNFNYPRGLALAEQLHPQRGQGREACWISRRLRAWSCTMLEGAVAAEAHADPGPEVRDLGRRDQVVKDIGSG